MQIWIFFAAGVGGDGFANLLEHSPDIYPIDGEKGYWRVHRIVDGQIKFYAPTIDQDGCFRSCLRPFRRHENRLNDGYRDLVQAHKSCVITSHDITLAHLEASDCQDILCQDQCRVLLTGDTDLSRWQAATKNLQPALPPQVDIQVDPAGFDHVIDIRDVKRDWQVVKQFCDAVGIALDRTMYERYQSLLSGSTEHMSSNHNVPIYRSTVTDLEITYDLIDIWQRTESVG